MALASSTPSSYTVMVLLISKFVLCVGRNMCRVASHGPHRYSYNQSDRRHSQVPQDTAMQAVSGTVTAV